MKTTQIILFISLITTCFGKDIAKHFEEINEKMRKFNSIGAEIAWESSINPNNSNYVANADSYHEQFLLWQKNTCNELATLYNWHLLNDTQCRQSGLLCRGPKYTNEESRVLSHLYNRLQSNYSDVVICLPTDRHINHRFGPSRQSTINTTTGTSMCLKGESEFNSIMKHSSDELVAKYLWMAWRENVGPGMREPYKRMVNIQNLAARRCGYPNIGAAWRAELEIPNLRDLCHQLYNDILPLYKLLHGVVRFYLRRFYGEVVPERGPMPAHLFGSLWSQNWESLSGLMIGRDVRLDGATSHWTLKHMAKTAEDFYRSLGLPAMTDTFWRESVFTPKNNNTRCHGTAADMFKTGDFRILYCPRTTASQSLEDFYVIHHEMGHIQYYMAYEKQPALFRQANSALHETIGDTIMLAVKTPQHLNRLNIINDSLLFTSGDSSEDATVYETKYEYFNTLSKEDTEHATRPEVIKSDDRNSIKGEEKNVKKSYIPLFDKDELSIDTILLLHQALIDLPQIPFTLLIDEFRWQYFETDMDRPNQEFLRLARQFQGIAPFSYRREHYFDPGAMYLIADNTPAVRYFLSKFLQHQLFAALCKSATFGRRNVLEPLPKTIAMSNCDIYGSKVAGKLLKDIMSRGHSQPITEILQATIGEGTISASALLGYYRPLQVKLEEFVRRHNIPIGW